MRELLTAVRGQLDAGATGGILSVQGAATEPEGCAVRVNGSIVGRTPWTRVPLPVGNYAVQVECDPAVPGRIFRANIAQGEPTRLSVAARLSQSLDTSSGIALVYANAAELTERVATDVAELGRVLGVERVLVGVAEPGSVTVRAFEVVPGGGARLTGSAPIAEPVDTSSSLAAVERARSGRLLSTPDGSTTTTTTVPPQGRGADVAISVLGGSLLTIGVVGMGVGWYVWTDFDSRGQELNRAVTPASITESQRAFDDARTPFIIAGAAGGLLTSAGAALLVSQSDELVPWWSWVFGAAGLGLAGVGVYVMTTDGTCYGNASIGAACARTSPTHLLGAFLLEHAAPLLAVPITCWIRAAIGQGSGVDTGAATLRLDADGVRLSWSGSF
ncbi:MAG: PEGA domain-containing protein [Kofleriaceae bacterium]|nr:PEGA domain-containing protein [Kofleriaceae bacterium]